MLSPECWTEKLYLYASDPNEGQLKNQYQYQDDYSEFNEETGCNDFYLRSNYKGTGKDYVLGAFKWGWKNNGRTALHSGVKLNTTMSATSGKIIAHDYPGYKF